MTLVEFNASVTPLSKKNIKISGSFKIELKLTSHVDRLLKHRGFKFIIGFHDPDLRRKLHQKEKKYMYFTDGKVYI